MAIYTEAFKKALILKNISLLKHPTDVLYHSYSIYATVDSKIVSEILPEIRMVSDGWAASIGIADISGGVYQHAAIVHAHNYVDSNEFNASIRVQYCV